MAKPRHMKVKKSRAKACRPLTREEKEKHGNEKYTDLAMTYKRYICNILFGHPSIPIWMNTISIAKLAAVNIEQFVTTKAFYLFQQMTLVAAYKSISWSLEKTVEDMEVARDWYGSMAMLEVERWQAEAVEDDVIQIPGWFSCLNDNVRQATIKEFR